MMAFFKNTMEESFKEAGEYLGKRDYKVTEYKDRAGEWRHRMQAKNNKIIDASSEGYHNLKDATDNRIMASIGYIKHYRDKLTEQQVNEILEILK